ncbi:MAG: GtrA family protein [Bacilli bacterium]|nr:GtrA family protein [Bacilli bacterium]
MKNRIRKIVENKMFLYGIFGLLTSILNVIMFYCFDLIMPYQIANLITLVIVKLIAFYCNKTFVFKSKCANKTELIKQFFSFVIVRGLTLLIDYFGLIIMIQYFNLDHVLSKIIITIVVVITNYVTGEKYVFSQKKAH